MRFIFGLGLSLFYVFMFSISFKKTKDIFSPLCFFSIIQFIAYVPGIVFFDRHLNVELNEYNVFLVFVMQMIVSVFVWLGSYLYRIKCKSSTYNYKVIYKYSKHTVLKGIIIFSCGAFAYIYFISKFGGIYAIISNTQFDYAAGNSYLLSLHILMPIGIIVLFDSKNKPNFFLVIILFILYSISAVIFTRRSPVMEALMMIVFAFHYKYKRIQLLSFFKPTSLFLIFIFSIFLIVTPQMRSPQGFDSLNRKKLSSTSENIFKVFEEFSFVSRDAFVYENYNINNMYYGRTFINIITAPIPSSLVSWKPPVDDGVYLANFIFGYYVNPPSNNYLINNSYPFSSQGSMYANFGFLGVIIGSMILGFLYEFIYKILIVSKYNSLMIFVYRIIIYKFALSSKNIVQSAILLILVILVYKVFNKIKIIKVKKIQEGSNIKVLKREEGNRRAPEKSLSEPEMFVLGKVEQ